MTDGDAINPGEDPVRIDDPRRLILLPRIEPIKTSVSSLGYGFRYQ